VIYRPPKPFGLWDTWLYPWEGAYHLFHLQSHPGKAWDHVAHAVSQDLLHWTTLDPILTEGPEGAWDHGPTLTGMVMRHDGRFWMSYGAPHQGLQKIGLLVSDDLNAWRKFEGNPVLAPAPPHYQAGPRAPFAEADWRDPCAVWNQQAGLWDAYICARQPAPDERNTGACIAHVQSRDLIHWDLRPPAAVVGERFFNAEVPDYFELAGRRYLLFSTVSASGRRLDTPTRERCAGTFYVMAEPGADYRIPPESLLIGAGSGRFDVYVGRTIAWQGGRLLYHHWAGPRPAWGLPKIVRAAADGALSLQFWPGAAGLESGALWEGFAGAGAIGMEGLGKWRAAGDAFHGNCSAMTSTVLLGHEAGDFHLTCEVQPAGCERAALLFRVEREPRRGLALILDWQHNRIEIGRLQRSWSGGGALAPLDTVSRPLPPGEPVTLRVLARAEFVEVYVNDRWVFSTLFADDPQRGALGLAVEGGEAAFRRLRCAELEPLESVSSAQ
jgi:beta-fructofuranosidase